MSFGIVGKWLRRLGVTALLWLVLPSLGWAQSCATCGTGPACGQNCQMFHCPPFFHHCQEGPPRLCFKCGCPHPVCNPCDLPHWGYFETCWTPYPFPPDWSHCPTVPPAARVNLNPMAAYQQPPAQTAPQRTPGVLPPVPQNPAGTGLDTFPQPRRIEGSRPGY